MASQQEIRERVTNQIIEALQRGISPWHRPWFPSTNSGFHCNVITQRRYNGVNPLLLQIAALERGYQSKWWGSAEQWASLGGWVKGYSTAIVQRERITRGGRDTNGEWHAATVPLLRQQAVFNADQVNGVPRFQTRPPAVEVQPDFKPAERVVQATGADIRENEGEKAWYHYPPAPGDFIEIPSKFDFIIGLGGLKSWYNTIFHELFHWSEPRLGWNGGYDLNELRAEMGAGFLSAAIGIPTYGPTNHHYSHVDAWVAALRQDPRTIFRVASAASAAVNFILSFSRDEAAVSR